MKISFTEKLIGSGFFTGYIPLASGTFASITALAIYYLPNFEKPYIILPVIAISIVVGISVGNKFEAIYGKDPAECTIDEFAGMWISLLFLPKNIFISLIAFIVWRAMDIIKPFPGKKIENLKGGVGIMLDDVISGFYSLIILHLILIIFGEKILK